MHRHVWGNGRELDRSVLKPLIYLRYVDDIYGIWPHSEERLEEFHNLAISIHPRSKVEMRSSTEETEFLDILPIRKTER